MTDKEIKSKDNKWFILGSILASIGTTGAFLYTEINEDRVNQDRFNKEYVLGMSKLILEKSVKEAELVIDLSKERRAIIEATKP